MLGKSCHKPRLHYAIPCIVLTMLTAQPALAGTQTATMGVSATVVDDCSVSATSVAFGNVNVTSASAAAGTGGITVRCTAGTGWTATASAGSGTGATASIRKLTLGSDPTKTLNYALYVDSGYVGVWGDGSTGTAVTGTGTGVADTRTIYARIPTGQSGATQGTYTDSVTVTVTY
jgi:spore coat protein U-like protein